MKHVNIIFFILSENKDRYEHVLLFLSTQK